MSTQISTPQALLQIYTDEVQANTSELTDFSEGSLHDAIGGAFTTCQNEVSELLVAQFRKTFFKLAEGVDLETLAVDHFGDSFARPLAVKSTGAYTFSRPNADAGNCIIPAGTIVKTEKDANGLEIRFETVATVTMIGTSIGAQIRAIIAGVAGNADPNTVVVIESTLTDPSITGTNALKLAGGEEAPTDEEYRDIIAQKIIALAGATIAAVRGAALAVPGVASASLTTVERVVIDYDIENDQIEPGAQFFRIPYPILYIADENGNSSQALIDAVIAAIYNTKAAGVNIEVKGAVAVGITWNASATLNLAGPNYAELSMDISKITDSMTEYINTVLEIGDDFLKASADAYIMSIWGPSGTNDLTQFTTVVPTANVSVNANEKTIATSTGIE